MKILFLTSGRYVPSSRFRVLQWLPRLREAGHACLVARSRPNKYEHWPAVGFRLSQRLRRMNRWLDLLLAGFGRFDVVFLERELFHDGTWGLEERFRHVARRMVLDVDDGIFLNWPEKFARLAAMADGIIAGSELIADECRKIHDRVVVVPTCVDVARYPLKEHGPRTCPVFGWTGTSSNLRYLESLRQPFEDVATRRDLKLGIIADEPAHAALPQFNGVKTSWIPWHEPTEREDLLGFDVGIMPLPDEPWARFKCGLKVLQSMAAGLPAIASPVGVNPRIVVPGETGYLPATPADWSQAIERLAGDAELRRRMGEAARDFVDANYSLQANWPRWLAAVTGLA